MSDIKMLMSHLHIKKSIHDTSVLSSAQDVHE